MAFVLIIAAVSLIMASYHNNAKQLFSLVGGEFTGSPSFGKWFIAILTIGAIGYIKPLKSLSDSFIVLVLIVLFLSNRGFFAQFNNQIENASNQKIGTSSSPQDLGTQIITPNGALDQSQTSQELQLGKFLEPIQ